MWVLFLLILVFFIPILYSIYVERKTKLAPNTVTAKPNHLKEIVLGSPLKSNETEMSIHAVPSKSGQFPTRVTKLYLWVELGNLGAEKDDAEIALDVLTNELTSATEYVSILEKDIIVSRHTPNRQLLNISAHLGNHALTSNSVLMITRKTPLDRVIVPMLLLLRCEDL